MIFLKSEKNFISTYVDTLQGQGLYTLVKEEALKALQCKEQTFNRAVSRLVQKKRIGIIKPGFFVIVPIEYKSWGTIPPEWFIKNLMSYLQQPYYVGLLSAAAFYEAAHQQPQQFQIMTNQVVRRINQGKTPIFFFKKEHLEATPVREFQTQTGLIRVSTPEATAFDLVKFYKKVGHLNNIATVLIELVDKLDPILLVQTAKQAHYEWSVIQRLGYLLSTTAIKGQAMTQPLAQWLQTVQPRFIPLVSYKTYKDSPRDETWRLFINDTIEVDL